MAVNIFYALDSWDGEYKGSPKNNSTCNGEISYYGVRFCAYNGNYVTTTYDGGASSYAQLISPSLLYTPPQYAELPSSSAAYYIKNISTGQWLAGGAAFGSQINIPYYISRGELSWDDSLQAYPIWQVYTYNVTYNANSGTNAPAAQTKKRGVALTLTTQVPSRTGFNFTGWNTNPSGSGTSYSPGGRYNEDKDVELYAQWTPVKYTVSFDANGGTGAPASLQKEYGVNLLLAVNPPTWAGHNFSHWNTAKNDSGISYPKNGYYTANASATLYAIWDTNSYVITYHGNGGSGVPANQTKTYGVDLNLDSTKPSQTGYDFINWNTIADGSGTSYAPGAKYTVNASADLWAQWTRKSYAITYYANGGTGAPSAQTKYYGIAVTITSATPSRTGYNFVRWNTKADGSGTRYLSGATYSVDAKLDLYAEWSPVTYTISFNANGGTGAPAAIPKTHDQSKTLPTAKPSRAGYTFAGWNTNASGTGTTYAAGASYNVDGTTTLYAKWTANPTITISFNANGGTGAPASVSGLQGTSRALPTGTPTKARTSVNYTITYNKVNDDATISKSSENVTTYTNYTFSHWNTQANGRGTSYAAGASINLTSNTTLYAQYTTSLSGGATLPTGSLDQYVLKGWSTTEAGETVYTRTYIPTANTTMYAQWVPDGLGGMIRFESDSIPSYFTVGASVRLFGLADPGNDRLYTVAKTGISSGVVTVIFEEDFVSSGEQDADVDPLNFYGVGTFVPDMDYICSINNRLWGCSSAARTIYGSALGDPTDFWRYEGDALDAYAVAVGSSGNFTGCVAMNSNVLFFKQHTIHKLLGNYPAEYAVYTYEMDGVTEGNFRAAKNCEGVVIFVGEHGICTYSGADTGILSKELGEGNMNYSLACYDGEKYALSYVDDHAVTHTYVYDTRYRLWLEDDYSEVMDLVHLGKDNYVLLSDNNRNAVYRLSTGQVDESIDWHMTFKPYIETTQSSKNNRGQIMEKKRYTGIIIRMELPPDSWIKAEVKSDEQPWKVVARKSGSVRTGVTEFVISTPRIDKMQLRLSGHGPMTILSMEREYIIGSRR